MGHYIIIIILCAAVIISNRLYVIAAKKVMRCRFVFLAVSAAVNAGAVAVLALNGGTLDELLLVYTVSAAVVLR
jgi:hypothetical protein